MTNKNAELFLVFLAINTVVVICWGFAHESISFLNQSVALSYKHVTTHFSHHSWKHFAGNMLGMLLLLHIFQNKSSSMIFAFMVCILATAMYVRIWQIHNYLGSSALLYCVPGCWYANHFKTNPFKAHMVLAILLVYWFIISPLKSHYVDPAWQPMTFAHFLGFMSGLVVQLLHLNYEPGKSIE